MSTVRPGAAGATRVCPHCKATVLESAAICPGCRHHLRFDARAGQPSEDDTYCALSIDGNITPRQTNDSCEYCVVLDIRNERGEQIVRQVIGVGVLQAGESRRVNLSVDMMPVRAVVPVRQTAAPVKSPSAGPPPLKPPPLPQTQVRPAPQANKLPPQPAVRSAPSLTPGVSERLRQIRKP